MNSELRMMSTRLCVIAPKSFGTSLHDGETNAKISVDTRKWSLAESSLKEAFNEIGYCLTFRWIFFCQQEPNKGFPLKPSMQMCEEYTPGLVLVGGAGAVLIQLFLGRVRNACYSHSLKYACLEISAFSRGLCWQLAAFFTPNRCDWSAVQSLQRPERPSWCSGPPFLIIWYSSLDLGKIFLL